MPSVLIRSFRVTCFSLLFSLSLGLGQAVAEDNPTQADNEAFKKYQQSQSSAYSDFIQDQNQAFKLYRQTYQAAFADYKKQISQVWRHPEFSSKKKWVAYSNNNQRKTSVDFETGDVEIVQIVPTNTSEETIKTDLFKGLQDLQNLTYQQAYQLDPLAQKVDKVLQKKVAPQLIKTAPPSNRQIQILSQPPKIAEVTLQVQAVQNLEVPEAQKKMTLRYQMKPKDVNQRIKAFLPDVMTLSQKEGLPPALVLAFIKNESAFNPLAKSNVPAYGLMQIVPRSAGRDATQYLFGQQKLLSSRYLYTPDKNIQIGTAYLHILNYRYLKKIQNPESRLYCTIAAYNTGAGNVAKSFIGSYNISKASRLINQKKPQAVYNHLVVNLPYQETRRYLKKVMASYREYQKLFTPVS